MCSMRQMGALGQMGAHVEIIECEVQPPRRQPARDACARKNIEPTHPVEAVEIVAIANVHVDIIRIHQPEDEDGATVCGIGNEILDQRYKIVKNTKHSETAHDIRSW